MKITVGNLYWTTGETNKGEHYLMHAYKDDGEFVLMRAIRADISRVINVDCIVFNPETGVYRSDNRIVALREVTP